MMMGPSAFRLWRPAANAAAVAASASLFSYNSETKSRCEKLPPSKLQRRMTPIGRFSVVSESVSNPSIITLFMKLRGEPPLSAEDMNNLWKERNMSDNHPRFHYTVNDRLRFQPEPEDVVHITDTVAPANQQELKYRLEHMQMDRWNLSDSLWYMQVAASDTKKKKDETFLLFRGHHALADGASMSATLSDLFDERDDLRAYKEDQMHKFQSRHRRRKSSNLLERIWRYWVRFVKLLFGFCFAALYHITLVLLHTLWDANPWSRLFDASKRKRTVAWSPFAPVDQVKAVAAAFGDKVTINDVLVHCVAAALRKQLDCHAKVHNSGTLPKANAFHIAMPVHLGGTTGNNIGAIVARLSAKNDLLTVHHQLAVIKQTPMALLSYTTAKLVSALSLLSPPASWYAASNAGSIAVVSNNRGPPFAVHVQGRSLEQIVGFVPLPPGIPIGITVQSYAGNVNCAVNAEEWAVPDTNAFLVWMLEEYKSLVGQANRRILEKQQAEKSM